MASKGTKKRASEDQEKWIEYVYDGHRSVSSGASAKDRGDVRTGLSMIECKTTEREMPKWILDPLEKIVQEAYAENLVPALAMRFYNPDSILSDGRGNIDIVIRRVGDDSALENDAEARQEQAD